MLGKQPFALIEIGLHETLPRFGQADVAFRNLRESQELKGLRHRKQARP